jgi:secreted trypsin-like serine protease
VRRLILVLATMGVAVLLASGAALGITNGTPDTTNRYPYVGALVDVPRSGEPQPYCSGTLISPTVFLTAAHCYPENGNTSYVTFDKVPTSTSTLYSGTFHDDPNGNDIAVVIFDQAIPGIDPAKLPNLPTSGQFNDAAKGSKFTAVGYGGQLAPKGPGGPVIVYNDQRQWAVSTLSSVTRTYLRLSQKQGSGGTCYGDSGGPNFLGEYPYNYDPNHVPTIASITITGDAWCHTTNVTLRLDTAEVQDFLNDYV